MSTPENLVGKPKSADDLKTLGDVRRLFQDIKKFAENESEKEINVVNSRYVTLPDFSLDLNFINDGLRQIVRIQEVRKSAFGGFLYGQEYVVRATLDEEVDMLPLSRAGSLGIYKIVHNERGGSEFRSINKQDAWFNKFLELVSPQS